MAKSYDRSSYGSGKRPKGDANGTVRPARSFEASSSRYRRARAATPQDAANRRSAARSRAAGAAASRAAAANPYSRDAHVADYAKLRKRNKRRKILVACLVVALVLVLGGAGAAFAYITGIQSDMQSDVTDEMRAVLQEPQAPGDPFYMLLMGTDKSQDRERGDELDGTYRSDSIMLLRVDPQNKKVAAVSLMRDTQVDMGANGTQKLNAAYAIGGAAYMIEVVSDMAGVPISHYAEIDFDGFKEVVDALGGIDVNVPIEIDDPDAGGHLDAGQQTLNGDQALILCRARHAFDNVGKGDEYRAANQRMVIGAIAQKILDSDLPTMMSTVQTLAGYVTTDMGVTDILSLANNMRGMNMDTDFYSAVNPTVSEYINNIWWEIMDEDAWRTMMDRIDQGLPPTEEDQVDPVTGMVMASAGGGAVGEQATSEPRIVRSGTVSVRNGTDIAGAAASAAEKVGELGYTVDSGNANSEFSETLVVYETPDQQEYAQEIVDALGVGRTVQNNNEYLFTTDFLVVVGADWPQ